MKRLLTIVVGFLHDLGTGLWFASVLAVFRLERAGASRTELAGPLEGLQREFFYLGLACSLVVLATGAGRTFTYAYVGEVYGKDAERTRKKALVAKHVLLLAVFGAGTVWQYGMAFSRTAG